MEAIWMWRQFPRQIASDLSQFHHRRIAEWHQGDMSSYELLELLEHMPSKGAFKTAVRGGDLDEVGEMIRHMTNETARMRATFYAANGGEPYPPLVFSSPSERAEQEQKADEAEAGYEEFYTFADSGEV